MTEVLTATTATADDSASSVSWGAVIAGALSAAALTLILLSFGSAMGFSAVSPWSDSGVSAETFTIAAGIYLVVIAMLASTIGGYMSGRLRRRWRGAYGYEVQFRDTAHGLLSWALATIIGAALLGGAATFLVGGVASGVSAGATKAGTQSAGPNDYFIDTMFRPTANRPAPANASSGDMNREAQLIFARSIGKGHEFSAADRTYLAQTVAARTGLNQADAEKRVADAINQTKEAADKARKTAAALSIWLTISLLIGAFSASLAAVEGGQLRDRRWKGVFGTRAYNEARIET